MGASWQPIRESWIAIRGGMLSAHATLTWLTSFEPAAVARDAGRRWIS
jgi:hypothetical protein